jgi:BlaI family transcriptional regulator, penicillinase repressor
MSGRKSPTLTELELEIMHVLWRSDKATVDDIQPQLEEAGRPLALPSIRTMLSILMEKGYVARKQKGRGYLYKAKISRGRARKGILKDVLERAFDGSAADMVAALLSTRMASKEDMTQVKRLIREYEKERCK